MTLLPCISWLTWAEGLGRTVQGIECVSFLVFRNPHLSLTYCSSVPTLLSNVALMLFSVLFLHASPSSPRNHGVYNAPNTSPLGVVAYSAFLMFISLPVVIITYRLVSLLQ